MKSLIFAISLLSLGFQSLAFAAEPSSELSDELARRLIAEVLEIPANGIEVATVVEGQKRSEDGFLEGNVRRVTAVHLVPLDGKLVRRVRSYDFSWTTKYGWFYQETRSTRSGEEVRIWSETKGESVVK